jgi:hypothetical protein
MTKIADDIIDNLETTEYDVLDDIQDDDFIFVVNSAGQLKGISFPVDMDDDDDVNPTVEEIINFLVGKYKDTVVPPGTTLH